MYHSARFATAYDCYHGLLGTRPLGYQVKAKLITKNVLPFPNTVSGIVLRQKPRFVCLLNLVSVPLLLICSFSALIRHSNAFNHATICALVFMGYQMLKFKSAPSSSLVSKQPWLFITVPCSFRRTPSKTQ